MPKAPRQPRENNAQKREKVITELIHIPFVDISGGSVVDLLDVYGEQAKALAHASMDVFGPAAGIARKVALPLADRASRRWLERTRNPYLGEINAIAAKLGIQGVYALNVVFEWGCTTGAFETEDGIALRRVLDWGFPHLGENLIVTLQSGQAGDFHNITWPGIGGMYQGMAVGRFTAAINQAPMRRHGPGVLRDWIRNRVAVHKGDGISPAYLLRQVFETAENYAQAKEMLCATPVAVPVIYAMAGLRSGEGCIIERLENDFAVREMAGDRVCATNHFLSHLNGYGRGWLPRSDDSGERARKADVLTSSEIQSEFAWFTPPIANSKSRLAFEANPESGKFSLIGTAGAKRVTEVFRLGN